MVSKGSQLDLIRQIIQEQMEERSPTGPYYRKGTWDLVKQKATVITGVRRAGKSTLLDQIARDWKTQASPSVTREYFSFDFTDERFISITVEFLDLLIDAVEEYLELKNLSQSQILLLLDEIQEIQGWERFVTRILKKPRYLIAISGSSAKMLSREIATQLRGRTLSLELFPFSLTELAEIRNLDLKKNTATAKAQNKNLVLDYLSWGGFPEVALVEKTLLKKKFLQDYLHTLLLRDVIDRHGFSQVPLV